MLDPSSLRRRRGGSEFLIDCNIDDPLTASARVSISRGDFGPAEQLIKQTVEPNQRAYLAEALADWPGEPPFLAQWAGTGSPTAALVCAIQRMKWAWEARGGGYASTVSDKAVLSFFDRLPIARDALLDAARRNPGDATAMPWLMWCARGLGEEDLSDKSFREAMKRAPTLRQAYSSALLTKSGKWFGSAADCHEFARSCAAKAPAGSCASILLIEAHEYTYEQMEPLSAHRKNYWTQPATVAEVVSANDACKRSGLFGMNGTRVRHWLAYGLWRCGQKQLAAEHFQQIGKIWNERPWGGMRKGFNWLFNQYGKARRQCRA